MNSFRDLVKASRTIRRFDESRQVNEALLRDFIDISRYTPSAANKQPLKYMLSFSPELNSKIFPCLGWAAYLTDWKGPDEGERPAAYIIILADRQISETIEWDHSITAQTIMLAARDSGLGGCIIGALNRRLLRESLGIDEKYEIMLVLALGYPAEQVVVEEIGPGDDIRYYRDENGIHHVPKRKLEDIILE